VKILDRYIIGSVGLAFLACTGLFSFVLIAANAVKDIVERMASGQLPVEGAAKMLAMLLPFTLTFAAPMGLLAAVLLVFGRMSSRREIVALKAAGVPVWRFSAGIVLLGILVSIFCSYVNCTYAPTARAQYKAMLADIVQEEPLRFIIPGHFVRDFPGYVIYADSRSGGKLGNVWIWVLGEDKQVQQILSATQGSITYDEERNTLVLEVYEATVEMLGSRPEDIADMRPQIVIGKASFALPLDRLMATRKSGTTTTTKLTHMSLAELRGLRAEALAQMATADVDARAKAEITATRAIYNINRNFAFAFSPLALAMIAIPMGIQTGRQETYANMAIAMLLGLAYFLLIYLTGWAEKSPPAHPELLVWLPNLGFAALGIILTARQR
jgi:lipopolysaccharide export system permease protein